MMSEEIIKNKSKEIWKKALKMLNEDCPTKCYEWCEKV